MTTTEIKNIFKTFSLEASKLAEEFLNLSYNQINWKVNDSQWSIGECIEHLIRTNAKFIPVYEIHTLQNSDDKQLDFRQTFLGKFVLKSVMPGNKKKYKTTVPFNPKGSNIKQNIIQDFVTQKDYITKLVNNFDSSKMNLKISSPFARFIKYSIGDSFLIISNHNLRHLLQAKNVMQNKNFPSG